MVVVRIQWRRRWTAGPSQRGAVPWDDGSDIDGGNDYDAGGNDVGVDGNDDNDD